MAKQRLERKIQDWVKKNLTSKPIKCTAKFPIWEHEKEEGLFLLNEDDDYDDDGIEGYRIFENKSGIILIWELPKSIENVIDTLENTNWTKDTLSCDDIEDYESSEGFDCTYYINAKEEITEFAEFDGEGDTEVINYGAGNFGEPYEIQLFFEDGKCLTILEDKLSLDNGKDIKIDSFEEALQVLKEILGINENADLNSYPDKEIIVKFFSGIGIDEKSNEIERDLNNKQKNGDISYEEYLNQSAKALIEATKEFIAVLNKKFRNIIGSKIVFSPDECKNDLLEFPPNDNIDVSGNSETIGFYIVLKKNIPCNVLHKIFLSIDKYSFIAYCNIGKKIIQQDYCFGEIHEGYFDGRTYQKQWINFDNDQLFVDEFDDAKKLLLENHK